MMLNGSLEQHVDLKWDSYLGVFSKPKLSIDLEYNQCHSETRLSYLFYLTPWSHHTIEHICQFQDRDSRDASKSQSAMLLFLLLSISRHQATCTPKVPRFVMFCYFLFSKFQFEPWLSWFRRQEVAYLAGCGRTLQRILISIRKMMVYHHY